MNAQENGRPAASTAKRPSTGFVHSIAGGAPRKSRRPLTPENCSPARGVVIGVVAGSFIWFFLFAAAWAVDRHPLTTGALAFVALAVYVVFKAIRWADS